jgi:hypothetical protein
MSTKFVMFKMADGNEPILINPAHVCAAHQSGSAQVTLVMDYGEGGVIRMWMATLNPSGRR